MSGEAGAIGHLKIASPLAKFDEIELNSRVDRSAPIGLNPLLVERDGSKLLTAAGAENDLVNLRFRRPRIEEGLRVASAYVPNLCKVVRRPARLC